MLFTWILSEAIIGWSYVTNTKTEFMCEKKKKLKKEKPQTLYK